jgi:hypothetical protein
MKAAWVWAPRNLSRYPLNVIGYDLLVHTYGSAAFL